MTSSCSLADKECVPCKGGVPPLEGEALRALQTELGNNWQINKAGHLHKTYKFKNFMEAMGFANEIAALAEEQGHHPDLHIAWGACSVEIWTHKISGLTESDFILAAKVDGVLRA